MGNFGGHALPGSFFIVFALWWTVQMFVRYYGARRRNDRFTSTAIFKCNCLCGKFKDLPLEACIKIFLVSIGFGLEIKTGFRDGQFVNIGNGQHATMFFFFGFTGIMDLLIHYKAPVPPNMDYISMIMAVSCEFILFKFHLHGRPELNVLLHTLLLYAIAGNIIGTILEMKYRNNFLCALSRPYFMLLQGTWFWQLAFILYPPYSVSTWDEESHEHMMIATMMFAWHAMVDLLVILVIGGVIACIQRRLGHYHESEGVGMKRLIHSTSNGDSTFVRLNDDSESEIEFEKSGLLS